MFDDQHLLLYEILSRGLSQGKKNEKKKITTQVVKKSCNTNWSIVVECYYKVRWYGRTQVNALTTTNNNNNPTWV